MFTLSRQTTLTHEADVLASRINSVHRLLSLSPVGYLLDVYNEARNDFHWCDERATNRALAIERQAYRHFIAGRGGGA